MDNAPPAATPRPRAAAPHGRQKEVNPFMKGVLGLFAVVHGLIALLFAVMAVVLIAIAAYTAWTALADGLNADATLGLIEALGVLAVAAVGLQIAQTIAEEEVVREAHVSGPTRVRRFLSRFMLVVVVALAIEGLIAIFKALRDDPSQLPQAASVLLAVGVVLAGWGVFVKLNSAAEVLEPEAMERAKSEDAKLE